MSNDPQKTDPGQDEAQQADPEAGEPKPRRGLLPGLAAISLYLMLLSGVIILGFVKGGLYPRVYLVFAAVFMAASAGLILLFRWAWALALGAVFLLAVYNLWIFATEQQTPGLVQGLLNMVFFLYLVRTEVRVRLR
jgi:uncharacterized membrane protein (DUF2068 family)